MHPTTRLLTTFALSLAALLACGCQSGGPSGGGGAYRVNYVPGASIVIDGKCDEPAWDLAEPLTSFHDPWREGQNQEIRKSGNQEMGAKAGGTSFRAFRDDTHLYFAFVCADSTPRFHPEWRGEETLNDEDRVEIYFALDDKLARYYCVEVDAAGRVHDFLGAYPRKWDTSWNMPGLKTAGRTLPTGYVVEGSIPLAELAKLGVPALGTDSSKFQVPGSKLGTSEPRPSGSGGMAKGDGPKAEGAAGAWRMGLFRADLDRPGSDGVFWLTWIDPHTDKPDFHTPSAFGWFVAGETKRVGGGK